MKHETKWKQRLARFDPVGKPRKTQFWLGIVTGLLLLGSGLFFGLMNLWFGTGRYGKYLFDYYFTQPGLVLLNALPFVLLVFLLWVLTNRAWIAFLVTGVFTLIYSFAEYWKLLGRSDPIVAEDLTVISEGLKMGGSYIVVTRHMLIAAALVVLGTLVFFFLLRGRLPKLLPRLGIAALLIGASVLLYTNVYTDRERYDSYPCWGSLNRWIDSNVFISKGCMYPFLYSVRSAVVTAPEGYQEQAAVALLEQYPTDDIPEERKVNVIVVMYEAFADLSRCTDRITAADPYAAFHRLQSESLHGSLVTNIFAAGTIDTERCVLTGFSTLTSFRRASWSYARYFAEQGYAVNGSHPGYEAFYNRLNVNANLGIENYRFRENYYEAMAPDRLISDGVLLPEIEKLCREDLQTADHVFSFNVTYQNHGPYPEDTQSFAAPYVPKDGLDDASYTIVNNYLHGVEDTGNQMLALADRLREDETPWILVFFGDHKPWLGDQNSVYTALDIDLTSETETAFYNYYSTEYLIWANNAAKKKLGADLVGEGPSFSPCFLMNELFDACGWEGPSYQKLSDRVRAMLPVVSTKNRFLQNGVLVSGSELTAEEKQALQEMQYAQYYLARDSGGRLPAAN